MILIILGVFLVLLNLALIYTTMNLLRKNETAEDFIVNAFLATQTVLQSMRDLDTSGAFEADDETGVTFQALKDMVEDYADFMGVEVTNDDE